MTDIDSIYQSIELEEPYHTPICFIDAHAQLQKALPKETTLEQLQQLYYQLTLTRAMDTKAVNLQRTGQMSTYPSSRGQEAVSVGLGHAMRPDDVLCPYYRDQGAFLQRGVSVADIYNFWGGDERGSVFINNPEDLPVCIPIAGQYLHATGVAFALKHRKQHRAVVTTGGEGSTSKGDFYEAINLSGAWQLPVVYVINNNQWAISVPRDQQTHCQSIAQKAIAAGFQGIQVDGNDVVAVRTCVEAALNKARDGGGPTLIEAICYRLCDHTTADDATRYQNADEVKNAWKNEPITRLAHYLEQQGAWSKQQEQALQQRVKSHIEQETQRYLQTPAQDKKVLFDYLYGNFPDVLHDQTDELGERA